jgi:hypothetical protein
MTLPFPPAVCPVPRRTLNLMSRGIHYARRHAGAGYRRPGPRSLPEDRIARIPCPLHSMPGAQRTAIGITGNKGEVESGALEEMPGVAGSISNRRGLAEPKMRMPRFSRFSRSGIFSGLQFHEIEDQGDGLVIRHTCDVHPSEEQDLFLPALTAAQSVFGLDRQHHLAKSLCLSNSSPSEGTTAIDPLRGIGSLTSKYSQGRQISLAAAPDFGRFSPCNSLFRNI